MHGIFIIDKPDGMTSHDVVHHVRKKFRIDKVGHLGTLDPMATGVLPVCLGKATRMGQFLPNAPKEYMGEIRFGFSTNTYDSEGERTSDELPLERSREQVELIMREFAGSIDQVPPPFSAKKIGGVPSYKLARKGRAIGLESVKVEIEVFELTGFEPPLATFKVVCSPGTYVRSLAYDLGRRLGCGAHLTSLRRTRSGDFHIDQAAKLEEIAIQDLIPIDHLLESWPRIDVEGADENRVVHGNRIAGAAEGQFARIFNKKGEFLAVAAVENGWVRPRVVLTSTTSD